MEEKNKLTTKSKQIMILVVLALFIVVIVVLAVFTRPNISSDSTANSTIPNFITKDPSPDNPGIGYIEQNSYNDLMTVVPEYLLNYVTKELKAENANVIYVKPIEVTSVIIVVYARINYSLDGVMQEGYYYVTFNKKDGAWQEPTFKNKTENTIDESEGNAF